MDATSRLVEAVLVTADHREVPLKVALPAPPTFTVHRANGLDQIFTLDCSSFEAPGSTIVYVEGAKVRNTRNSVPTFLPLCPVCGGPMEAFEDNRQPSLFMCDECQTGVVVPLGAWHVARTKRELKWRPKNSVRTRNQENPTRIS